MANLHASLDSTCKSRISKISYVSGGIHSTTFDPKMRNERFTLMPFMGFPAILSTLQPFQSCIFNGKDSKLTFSNGPQLMGKGFMANLHASLDSTYKNRISKLLLSPGVPFPHQLTTRYQILGSPFHGMGPFTRSDTFLVLPCASL